MTKGKPINTTARDGSNSGRFAMSRLDIAKLSAVEGLQQSQSSRAMFNAFDRARASPEERRREIIAKYSVKKG